MIIGLSVRNDQSESAAPERLKAVPIILFSNYHDLSNSDHTNADIDNARNGFGSPQKKDCLGEGDPYASQSTDLRSPSKGDRRRPAR